MAQTARYDVGDVVRLRKQHPCGGFEWQVTRIGADFRMKCVKCGRSVMVPRVKFERSVKAVVSRASGDGEDRRPGGGGAQDKGAQDKGTQAKPPGPR